MPASGQSVMVNGLVMFLFYVTGPTSMPTFIRCPCRANERTSNRSIDRSLGPVAAAAFVFVFASLVSSAPAVHPDVVLLRRHPRWMLAGWLAVFGLLPASVRPPTVITILFNLPSERKKERKNGIIIIMAGKGRGEAGRHCCCRRNAPTMEI